jgi:aquaporin related protein
MKSDSRSLFGNLREDVHAATLEFIGTVCVHVISMLTLAKLFLKILFLLLGLGGIQASAFSNKAILEAAAENQTPSIERLLYISVSMGLSLLVSVWFFYR